MARPEKNSVDYFPFIVEEGKKMFYIEEKYGNDGFATFVKILRELAKTEFHFLNLSDETTIMFLSSKCKVSEEKLLFIIEDLSKLGKFDKELWGQNKVIWCQDFIDGIQDAYKKRNNKCITLEGLLILLSSKRIRKPIKSKPEVPDKPQSKVKKTKVKKTILKESKEEEIKKGVVFPFDSPLFFTTWISWRNYKKVEHRFNYKSIESEQAALMELNNLSEGIEAVAIQMIKKSMAQGWKGFFKLGENGGNSKNKSTELDINSKETQDWLANNPK